MVHNSNGDRPDVDQQQVPAYNDMKACLNQAGKRIKAYYKSTYPELPSKSVINDVMVKNVEGLRQGLRQNIPFLFMVGTTYVHIVELYSENSVQFENIVPVLGPFRSSRLEMFLRKGVLKTCNKFTGKQPCRSVISMKLQSNFIEITLRHGCSPLNLLHIFRTPFLKNTSGRLLLSFPSAIVICIYKRFRGLSIADVLVSSGVIVEGSVDQALRGKHYRDVE